MMKLLYNSTNAHNMSSLRDALRPRVLLRLRRTRALWLTALLLTSMRMFGVGWTPTDCGMVVNFSEGDQFLLSVWIDVNSNGVEDAGEEYFVCDYPSHTGGRFNYTGVNTLKLIPQAAGATAPSASSVWTVDTAMTRPDSKNALPLGGVSYTMWSSNNNQTLVTDGGDFKFLGNLTTSKTDKNICDVVFAVPTNRSTDADPGNTLGHGGAFDGAMGKGFLGMTYREVYWFDIPRRTNPSAYVNASLVTFNTTLTTQKWGGDNPSASNNNSVIPGQAAYAFADPKHDRTTRTVFRMYVLGEKQFVSCPSYFFGWDVQDVKAYRKSNTLTDLRAETKVYYLDHFVPMNREGSSAIYKTAYTKVPSSDSTYFYIGKGDKYYSNLAKPVVYLGPGRDGEGKGALSQFRTIKALRVKDLAGAPAVCSPEAGACGKMVVDTTSAAENLGVTFEPAGYFFHTSSGANIRMRKDGNDSTWITEQMWTLTGEYMKLQGEVLLYTGEEFSETDPGVKISNWSEMMNATSIPGAAEGKSGWARIHTKRSSINGGIEFVEANTSKHIHYDYNTYIGVTIPDGYPVSGSNTVMVEDARLKNGFTFLGWATSADGDVVFFPKDTEGDTHVGDPINLAALPDGLELTGDTVLNLYAKGTFDDTYRVAFSFIHPTDGKRYFLTHPNSSAPRHARARTFTDWTNVYQGMSDAENSEPNYLSTYKMIGYPTCDLCAHEPSYESLPESDREYVLDPQHETVRGVEDELTFYENWAPANDEFIGLYYIAGYDTIIANNTWAGAFKSSQGWPAYNRTAVDNTKLSSRHYFTGMKTKEYAQNDRPVGKDYIRYDAARDQFGGVATEGEATSFQITGIAVADAHYVILPDTLDTDHPWVDEVVFEKHRTVQDRQVWSKLIGKQLMACLRVGADTVYFHPNNSKTVTTAGGLRLSTDYRLTQTFSLIRDQRPEVKGYIAEGDSVTLEEGENGFYCTLHSGASTPIGPTQDIVDTLRVRLRPTSASKIKNYYGRWKTKGNTKAPGLHTSADGSRYRDILVRTRTYHYGSETKRLVLTPDRAYIFSPLKGVTEEMHFTLSEQTYMPLLNAAGEEVGDSVLSTTDRTADFLHLDTWTFTFKSGDNLVVCPGDSTQNDKATIRTKVENTSGVDQDTLTVSISSITVMGTTYTDVKAVIPVSQASLDDTELIWSVVYNKERYFIMAEASAFRCQTFTIGSRVVRNGKELFKGSYAADRKDDRQHITPWSYTYHSTNKNQLSLKTEYSIDRYFNVSGGAPQVSASDSVFLTYEFIRTYVNDNANYEEIVKLKYGDQWLKFNGTTLVLTPTASEASEFSWGYMQKEYYLLNNGNYPSPDSLVYIYNNASAKNVQTRFKAYSDHSMLLGGNLVYLCKVEETNIDNLTSASGEWKIKNPTFTRIPDARFYDAEKKEYTKVSGLGTPSTVTSTLITTITPATAASPTEVMIGEEYVDIVDTLQVTLEPRADAPTYRFKDWAGVSSFSDACVKIPLVRKTYHTDILNEVVCVPEGDDYNFAFPATLPKGVGVEEEDSCHVFNLKTYHRTGRSILDIDNNVVSATAVTTYNQTSTMDLDNSAYAEVRLVDEKGQNPDWCSLEPLTDSTVTVKCTKDGIRSPRQAYIYMAYMVTDHSGATRVVNYRLTVSQQSKFEYANNQTLLHSRGITDDDKDELGRQQVHENKRILYYYNPEPYDEVDQNVELPVRERGFYGWWRWYREGEDERGTDVSDADVPDEIWIDKPRNVGTYNNPFRTIGDSVKIANPDYDKDDPKSPDSIKVLKTMGRYTVFHYPSLGYGTTAKKDPPSKSPTLKAPTNEKTLTYAVDISNYYDNLPLSMTSINQVDQEALDASLTITEPTLSIREIFELHPWTEMADTLEHYKSANADTYELANEKYMEDHVVMAPVGRPLLLSTEQRYRYDNLKKYSHSESLLGYYMHDDNWSKTDGKWADGEICTKVGATAEEIAAARKACRDTMIWCGGWDADCVWYTYDPSSKTYTECEHPVTEGDDFLNVPAKGSITGGASDVVYYCLRARSKKTTDPADDKTTTNGDNWFNICRYKVIYHDPKTYGPLLETTDKKTRITKAIITNDEIEQDYEVLERLNFDYYQPGEDYHVYEHPLPWADASYGYSYPVGPEIPDNRYHNDFAPNFPGPGEYGIINRIPYSKHWNTMEQHGGAENGFMIYCDGMSSSGQVAALSLSTHLCEGQKMYFSAYIGNPSKNTGAQYARPNFTFSVQGWDDKAKKWEDITSYMTGDLEPSNRWSQIYFPIEHDKAFDDFRIRIYNMASNFDGNDFIIDDMCVFATKPPLIAYQANTKCVTDNDSLIHVVLRVDYQGFIDKSLNDRDINYTVEEIKGDVSSFVPMIDGYFNQDATHTGGGTKPDTIFGAIYMPPADYYPQHEDSVFDNLSLLAARYEETYDVWEEWRKSDKSKPEPTLFRQGYIYENLDGNIRPVLYTMHKAKMTPDNTYNVRMSLGYKGLMSSECAMTSNLKVTSRMMLMVNGEEQETKTVSGLCSNTIYDVSMRVRATVMDVDSVAPIDMTGGCYNDWLLYGDTSKATSATTYGYLYSDIVTIVQDILRYEPGSGESNVNRFARNIGEVNRNVMNNIQRKFKLSSATLNAYDVLADLVNRGLLVLYQSDMFINVVPGETAKYVVFPIVGTGTDDMHKQNMDVCPNPIVITLSPKAKTPDVPLMIGGIIRNDTLAAQPIAILADAESASKELAIRIDFIRPLIGIHAVTLLSTDDPNFRPGVHRLSLTPDKVWPRDLASYYTKGDNVLLRPASSNNYQMQPGYNYTFTIEMTSATDSPIDATTDCPIGDVPMIVSIVPDYLRWAPANKSNDRWNDPMNWIGVTADNTPLPIANRFAPLPSTDVIIPPMPDSLPYPVLQRTIAPADSVKQVGFVYNTCDDIRFLPGAAIRQQQLLTSDVLVVDMPVPQQKWALRSAPVTGLISGDLYMADADLSGETKNWSVGTFDASGRSWSTGNASFWLSLYNQATEHLSREAGDAGYQRISAATEWSKVTNGMTLSLPPAQGWAVYARTASGKDAEIRLPKNDDTYYYYGTYGERLDDRFVGGLRTTRNTYASGTAGQLAFNPGKDAGHQDYNLTIGEASKMFVFGNPTLGYIDIWGFIADNATNLDETIGFIGSDGIYTTANKTSAEATTDTISELQRYLPPMHAMVINLKDAVAATCSLTVTLDTSRIVTHPRQLKRPLPAPSPAPIRNAQLSTVNPQLSKGIMTITAVNPVSNRCLSRLLLGQGYDDAIVSGEDAVLTTLNIDNFHMTNTPTTPFNLYAVEGDYGLSIDLRQELLNVPISFYMSQLPYDPVTQLWFTGVNNISGTLVLYDALTDTERIIADGVCLTIETPEVSHEKRYYIRRPGYSPDEPTNPVATGTQTTGDNAADEVAKIIRNGQIFILRGNHVYSIFGQKLR